MSRKRISDLKRIGYLPVHQLYKQKNKHRSVSSSSKERFRNILQQQAENESNVFVHAGLSDVKTAFNTNPYSFLTDQLSHYFKSIITPGFTDYFKTSGIYHKKYSKPKHGKLGQLFVQDADYRTDDAIKSFLVKGPYRFKECDHHDSYGSDGCFAKLVDDDILVMNIGVPWITCSHFHYFESRYDVDYMVDRTFDGILYRDDCEYEQIQQTCGYYISKYYSWNKPKIQNLLESNGVLDKYDLNGLKLLFFNLQDVKSVLGKKMESNPNYLVTL